MSKIDETIVRWLGWPKQSYRKWSSILSLSAAVVFGITLLLGFDLFVFIAFVVLLAFGVVKGRNYLTSDDPSDARY